MDAVITFVDGNDPRWQQDYLTATQPDPARGTAPRPALAKRYRDWGTLPYLLRGIERYMPFIERVFLVVSRESQVPDWVNRTQVQIVYHADIIPSEYLPTFNSATIELFLHRIPGLSEQYLYFNDDIFPVGDLVADDFFPGGKAACGFSRHLFALRLYKIHTCRADRLARLALGLRPTLWFLRPQHSCTPMLRSACEEVFRKLEPQLLASLTPLRAPCNCNQYLFLDYQLLSGRGIVRRLSNQHLSLATVTPARLAASIREPRRKILCINDVEMSPARFATLREAMLAAFADHFPDKSRFER